MHLNISHSFRCLGRQILSMHDGRFGHGHSNGLFNFSIGLFCYKHSNNVWHMEGGRTSSTIFDINTGNRAQ